MTTLVTLCDGSIVLFVGKVRFGFFLYTYITDTFYLLVVNCCCCFCPTPPGMRGPPFTCAALARLPPRSGPWWPAAAKKPKTSFFSRCCA